LVLDKENEGEGVEEWPSAELLDRRRCILSQPLVKTISNVKLFDYRLRGRCDESYDAQWHKVSIEGRSPVYCRGFKTRSYAKLIDRQQKTQKRRNIKEEKIEVVRPGEMKSRYQGREHSAAGVLIVIWE
jgi:hypothetical protein